MEEYSKALSRPEARHRYWHIPKSERSFFPEKFKIFKLAFDGDLYSLKVNHKDDIMTGQLYKRYRFLEGDIVIIKKKDDRNYTLTAPDTKLYPKIKS